jgi:ureidoacrylate peracid hydrolase
MHKVGVRQEVIDRVMKRRGKVHVFDDYHPKKTALVVIDMQGTFCDEVATSRGIVPNLNALTPKLRELGVPVMWVLHANSNFKGESDWDMFYNYFVSGDIQARTIQANSPENQAVYSGLDTESEDMVIVKNRYSALIPGSSALERVLRSLGIDSILIAGTKTNICCESTARDAMMMDFRVTMLEDCCAALSDDEHRTALENIVQQFGNVMTGDEVVKRLQQNAQSHCG